MLECTDICAIETIDGSRTVNLVEQHVVDPFVSDLVAAAATDETTLLDLELFDAYVKDEETVFDSVDFTTTHGGAAVLRSVMARPIVDIAALERRRDAVRAVSDVYDRDEDRTERLLKTMHDNVDTVAWFMHGRTDEENALIPLGSCDSEKGPDAARYAAVRRLPSEVFDKVLGGIEGVSRRKKDVKAEQAADERFRGSGTPGAPAPTEDGSGS